MASRWWPWVRCVVLGADGRLLLVARKGNGQDWIFPGGRMDIGESTPRETVFREVWEETGVRPLEAVELCQFEHAKSGRPGTMFWAPEWERVDSFGEEVSAWGTWRDVAKGSFGPHAKDIARALDSAIRARKGY